MLNRRFLRVKVLQQLFSYYSQSIHTEDRNKLQRDVSLELVKSITNVEKYFFDIISIVIVFADINLEKKEIAKSERIKKSKSRFNLSQNLIIKFLRKDKLIIDSLIKYENTWNTKEDHLRDWYGIMLNEDFYKNYIDLGEPSVKDDFNFIENLILKFLIKNEVIRKYFDEGNLYWNEDRYIISSMLKKTVKSLNSPNFNTFAVASLSEDIDEDLNFASSLFDDVTKNTDEYDSYIDKYAKNWELERISMIDISILRMGIGEMISFKNIPTKVTINECIDIAKSFSSNKSGNFVNGLLDVISLNLLNAGKITKTGKGLIDNK
ncbi:MAG: transcription antitermination factor NusB [Cytophagia bacterium]|nr:transcription antitermination factor NusB [Cytophagia bacterium]